MAVANWIAFGSFAAAALSAVIAWQAIERNDVASLAKIENDYKKLSERVDPIRDDVIKADEVLDRKISDVEARITQMENALATIVGKFNAENSIRVSVAEYDDDYQSSQKEIRNKIIELCDRKRECQVDLSSERFRQYGSSNSKFIVNYRCGTTSHSASVKYRGRLDINCL